MWKHQGNMLNVYDEADYFIFTGNSYLKKGNVLVMGRGLAKEVKKRFPGKDLVLGSLISLNGGHLGMYGFVIAGKIGVLQVKKHYADTAKTMIIRYSLRKLTVFAERHSEKQIHINYPGIGFGRLKKSEVYPLLRDLPDNIHVWER